MVSRPVDDIFYFSITFYASVRPKYRLRSNFVLLKTRLQRETQTSIQPWPWWKQRALCVGPSQYGTLSRRWWGMSVVVEMAIDFEDILQTTQMLTFPTALGHRKRSPGPQMRLSVNLFRNRKRARHLLRCGFFYFCATGLPLYSFFSLFLTLDACKYFVSHHLDTNRYITSFIAIFLITVNLIVNMINVRAANDRIIWRRKWSR